MRLQSSQILFKYQKKEKLIPIIVCIRISFYVVFFNNRNYFSSIFFKNSLSAFPLKLEAIITPFLSIK